LILAGHDAIAPEHLPGALGGGAAASVLDDVLVDGFRLDGFVRELLQHAIARAGGNKAAAARLLGITRRRLYSLLAARAEDHADDGGE